MIRKFILTGLFLTNLFLNSLLAHSQTHPGAMSYPDTLKKQLATALENKADDYSPRTRFIRDGKPYYTNRLILEDSPYLLQHAHNPVNWFPWGKEAFEQAKKEHKPIFLSIGYATCHWCHVMEEQSFENEEIAKLLNENFISIKVDREQHPDVDETYMTAVMLINGSGGWPMSSFLLPNGKPFFGGTYFPPAQFTDLLNKVSLAWKEKNADIIEQADELAATVQRMTNSKKAVQTLSSHAITEARENIFSRYDPINGGFSQAPKFPNEPSLFLLLQTSDAFTKENVEAFEHTLLAMAQGGIYDQIGGGFHRYSTDNQWLAPHFEKMLYNQAYLSQVYAEAWRQNANPLHARIARQTLDYVLREMTSVDGGFYSATDADSEGEEGTYFIWDESEIRKLLKSDDADFIIRLYAVTAGGNFEGRNILHLPQSLTDIALQEGSSLPDLLARVDRINKILRKQRETRIPPLTDNKVIVAWNGMMISALAEIGELFDEDRYRQAAIKAAEFLWQKQRTESNDLWRVNLDGKPSIEARQDDYAHYAEALLTLYDVSDDPKWLQRAVQISDRMIEKFLDKESGAFLMGNDQLLFAQPKSSHDGAIPSGNSVAVRVLSRLAVRTGKLDYEDRARAILQAFSSAINEFPASYAYMLAQLDELENGEISAKQYAARGAIKIHGQLIENKDEKDKLLIKLSIAEGWHINTDKPAHEDLIPTKIKLIDKNNSLELKDIQYPKATMKKVEFEEEPLALYQGQIEINAELISKSENKTPLQVEVQIQACNQQACLPPETLSLSLKRTF